MNKPVNSELAKQLKKKGFNLPTNSQYYYFKDCHYNLKESDVKTTNLELENDGKKHGGGNLDFWISAPTIIDVVMWLYEKHGIWVTSKKVNGLNKWFSQIYTNNANNLVDADIIAMSPVETYEAAIEYCVKELI